MTSCLNITLGNIRVYDINENLKSKNYMCQFANFIIFNIISGNIYIATGMKILEMNRNLIFILNSRYFYNFIIILTNNLPIYILL